MEEMVVPGQNEPGLTDGQKELRKKGIGGSEIAAVAGLSPWAGPLDVYLAKTGQSPADEDNENLDRGRYLEDGLRKWFCKKSGLSVRKAETMVHPVHGFLVATPDGIVVDGEGRDVAVLELKAPQYTADHWGEEYTANIPEYYIPQVMQEMACAGLPEARVGAMLWGRLTLYRVPFDEELWDGLVEIARDFWENHVLPRVPPSPHGSKLAAEWMASRFPAAKTKDMVLATPRIDEIAKELRRVQEESKELERREAGLKSEFMEAIGEHQGVVGEWGRVTWGNVKGRASTDWQGLVKHLGGTEEAVAKFTSDGKPYRQLRASWKGGA